MKGLAIVAALLAGSASLAIAQGPPTGGYPPVAGGAAGNPAVPPAPSVYGPTPTPSHHATRHHRRMYMQGDVHRGSKHTGSALSTRKFLNNQNSYR